jgi:cellulase
MGPVIDYLANCNGPCVSLVPHSEYSQGLLR